MNAMAEAASLGSATRRMGVRLRTSERKASFWSTWLARSVAVYQGATALTRMPSLAHSHAKFLVSWFMAAFVAPYSVPDRMATSPATDELNTMLASEGKRAVDGDAAAAAAAPGAAVAFVAAAALSSGCASWHRWYADWKLVANTWWWSSDV
eukprot:TRINITY_DN13143_c0_g1_i1.p2 TRINITY_DN13143_c0_g1~~TRINITY_DN13143_c0_g1_i1.p2  ORF type:complete len:152 (+),score=3.37 TRINITY_DN13143_c0_g1_i1:102-557(+)